jgi:hypothetical protein
VAELSAGRQEWDVVIMDHLGPVGAAIISVWTSQVISSIWVLPGGIRLAHSVLTSTAA